MRMIKNQRGKKNVPAIKRKFNKILWSKNTVTGVRCKDGVKSSCQTERVNNSLQKGPATKKVSTEV